MRFTGDQKSSDLAKIALGPGETVQSPYFSTHIVEFNSPKWTKINYGYNWYNNSLKPNKSNPNLNALDSIENY